MSELCLYDAKMYLKNTFDFSIFNDILSNTNCITPMILVKDKDCGCIYYKDKDINYSLLRYLSKVQNSVKTILNVDKECNLLVRLLDNGDVYILTYTMGTERLTVFLDSISYKNKIVNIKESYTGKKMVASINVLYSLYDIVCDTLKILYPLLDLVQSRHTKIVIEDLIIATGIDENTCGVGHITSDIFQKFDDYKSKDISLQNKWGDDKLHCEYIITLKSNNMKDRS